MRKNRSRRGATLTDVFIGVPLLAMLAAVAVPTFKEAETRSKIAEVRTGMRHAAMALEAYQIDWGLYPFDGFNAKSPQKYNYWFLPVDLSTPIAYLPSASIRDPFREEGGATGHWQFADIRYRNVEATWGTAFHAYRSDYPQSPASAYRLLLEDLGHWDLRSVGPDGYWGPSGSSSSALFPGATSWRTPSGYSDHTQPYDPTNGAQSWGDLIHTQTNPWGYVNIPPPNPDPGAAH